MSLAGKLVEIAAREVGTRELGGNNRGARIEDYQRASWLEPGPWPWCAAFCCWVLREWLEVPGAAEAVRCDGTENWRCKDASCVGWEKWALARGLLLLDPAMPALPGDFVTFDFKGDGSADHIGIVVADEGTLRTIEGNTNHRGERDSESGDGVWEKVRRRSTVSRFIRVLP